MNERISKKTYALALNGISLAFAVALIFAASIIPGAEMTLYAMSGLFVGLVILETGVKNGILHYVGTIILSFVIVPNKLAILPYVAFFGLYGFAKYYAEKVKNVVLQIVLKLTFFIGIFYFAYGLFKNLFFENIKLPNVSMWILLIMGAVVFILYDYIYTLGLNIYVRTIKAKKNDFKLAGKNEKDEKR